MPDCHCDRIEARFDEPYATEKLALYQDAGPDPSTLALLDLIRKQPIEGATLLDIGGGVGAVQHELLRSGVSSVQEVEASAAYAAACQAEAERQGHPDSITHFVGDFGSVSDQVGAADIVTLDRSMCCWHDMPDLVERSAAKANWLYGVVYPRDTWWVRHGWRTYTNLHLRVQRQEMRLYAHRQRAVESILARHGLQRSAYTELGVWQIALYAKEGQRPQA
jgi:hypothetical protein